MRLFLSCILLLVLYSCGSSIDEKVNNILESEKLTFEQKIERILSEDNVDQLGFTKEQSEWIYNFYHKRDFKPLWYGDSTMSDKGWELFLLLKKPISIGIPDNRIHFEVTGNRNRVIKEIILTAQTATILHDLKHGFFNDTLPEYKHRVFADPFLVDSIANLPDTLVISEYFTDQGLADTNYRFLAKHLYDYTSKYPIDRTKYSMKAFKEDSLNTLTEMRKSLISKGYLLEQETDSLEIDKALKLFQKHNSLTPDGKIGKHTATALNESTYDKLLRTAFVMDKMRRMTKRPVKYVYINIPEFTLRYYANDSLKNVHRIVVGKPENKTPTLTSKIHSIVVYPYWNVPYSISSKEILPMVQRNVGYLKKNNYKIYKNKNEINPYKVNWSKIKKNSFPYQVIQDPGPGNSLGILKFEFHNKYSVYVHDTPSKSLFKTNIRAYSHGCMRCENPIELAKSILHYDSLRKKPNAITPDSLDSLIGVQENHPIKLKTWVPVYVEYNSVTADKENLFFHIDIYRKDEEYLKVMGSDEH